MSGSASSWIVTGLVSFSISGGEGSGNPFATAFMSTCGCIFGERIPGGKDLPDPRKSWFPPEQSLPAPEAYPLNPAIPGELSKLLNIRFFNGFRYIRSRTVVRLQNYFFRQRLSVLLDSGGFVHMNAQVKPAQNDKPQVMHQHGGSRRPLPPQLPDGEARANKNGCACGGFRGVLGCWP